MTAKTAEPYKLSPLDVTGWGNYFLEPPFFFVFRPDEGVVGVGVLRGDTFSGGAGVASVGAGVASVETGVAACPPQSLSIKACTKRTSGT